MPLAFIIGTAGSGKSLFTAAFAEWLKMSKQDVAVVNLDPGALKLPYQPDVDVRNYVNVGDIMDKYGLGPNGAMIMAADLIADEIENLTRDIDDAHAILFSAAHQPPLQIVAVTVSPANHRPSGGLSGPAVPKGRHQLG